MTAFDDAVEAMLDTLEPERGPGDWESERAVLKKLLRAALPVIAQAIRDQIGGQGEYFSAMAAANFVEKGLQ